MVSSAVENSFTLHRSQSTPDFFAPIDGSNPYGSNPYGSRAGLAGKSLPSLPTVESAPLEIDFDDTGFDASSLCFKTDFLKPCDQTRNTPPREKGAAHLLIETPPPEHKPKREKDPGKKNDRLSRRSTVTERPRTWMGFKSSPDVRETLRDDVRPISREEYYQAKAAAAAVTQQQGSTDRDRAWSVSGSFPSFSLRSRGSASRSPSPAHKRQTSKDEDRPDSNSKLSKNKMSKSTVAEVAATSSSPAIPSVSVSGVSAPSKGAKSSAKKLSKASAFFLKRPQTLVRGSSVEIDDSDSCASSSASLAQTTVDSRSQPCSEGSDTSATDYTSASDVATPPDPLLRAFKLIDTEFSKFQDSKTTNMRMVVVRNSLLPFLKQYVAHASNRHLKAAHLEFRASVLDKWWSALLDILDGRSTGHISGVDRPQLLETISMVMMRPEWRQGATFFLPLAERSPRERVKTRARSWTSGSDGSSFDSLASSGSEFLAESAFHNVRIMFVGNLIKQMVIVIDKVSLRNTPASLVNFAGKACAYAFMFAPGVAEALVRIWGLSADLIRRVADEFKLPRRSHGESDDIVALFPLSLHSLGWTSVKSMSDTLKHDARLPLQIAKVNWHGPWKKKWMGHETDLFYIFCKYFYLLASEFMPDGLPLVEKARAPAFVPVHAQLLSLLDSTVHRQAAFDASMGPPFGDSARGVDASVLGMSPFGTNNLLKGMGENRMVLLLRDFLGDHSATGSEPRQTFAEAFMALVKASTKRTSQYDHNACFTLCDFIEEVLTAYSTLEMHEYDTGRLVDWPFWIEVWRRVLENHNVMSEIRMLSFLFSIWNLVSTRPDVKEMVCRDWLLTEPVFSKFFTHWSPMVRAYFMRLLCWRVCRDLGRAGEVDTRIFVLVSSRLKTVWSHYLWLKQKAEMEGKYPPSSAPCYPTPGKKFMIIRTEMPLTPMNGAIAPTGFDSFSSPLTTPSGLVGPPGGPIPVDTALEAAIASELPNGKKRWSLLSRVLTLSNNAPNARSAMDEDLDQVRREISASKTSTRTSSPPSGPPPPPKPSYATPVPELNSNSTDSLAASSPIVPDDNNYIFRFVLSWCAPNTLPPRERFLATPRLPGPAQARVNSRQGNDYVLPPAGKPIATRRYSGVAVTGLVAEARNADPTAEIQDDGPQSPRASMSTYSGRPSFADSRASSVDSFQGYFFDRPYMNPDDIPRKPPTLERMAQSKYSGKALAEWTTVVMECNGFIDRRRDEGVFGLSEVEVPSLGVEGFRRVA
ncbi:uncharacterized protein MKZ38_003136 [Zalerion maritima]|uniref:DUF1765-domain-containing protein n=1 Tax=Zalerion maritima TaxID=339359 RepID=A0AAD5S4X1_9PEZI|nr:uncharacterized protein MKZ38_003136 [Zalerion maritima]